MAIDVITPDGSFSDTVIGALVWPKSLGRPDKPRLADGFAILIHGTDVEPTAPGGPVHEIGFVLEMRVEEGDGRPDNWRLDFSKRELKSVEGLTAAAIGAIDAARQAQINRQATYRVTIALRTDVTWTTPQRVKVHPQERTFLKHDGLLELPGFSIAAA
jgi:hypothetical protein